MGETTSSSFINVEGKEENCHRTRTGTVELNRKYPKKLPVVGLQRSTKPESSWRPIGARSARPRQLPEAVWINPPTPNKCEDKKRPPEIHCPQRPLEEASLTHPRSDYHSASCVPAELASVSSDGSTRPTSQPLNTRVMPQKIPGVWGLAPKKAEKGNNMQTKRKSPRLSAKSRVGSELMASPAATNHRVDRPARPFCHQGPDARSSTRFRSDAT